MDDVPRVLDISLHDLLAHFAQLADGFRRIRAPLTHVLEMYVDTEFLSETCILIDAVRVHHVPLQFHNTKAMKR